MKGKGNNKNKGRYRGNRGRSNDSRRDQATRQDYRDQDRNAPSNAENDISWYSRYPNLLVAAGSFPYPYRPGMDLSLGNAYGQVGSTEYTQHEMILTIPGVMAMKWIPNFGPSSSPTDPPSIMAKEMYARVRAAYSGKLDADAPDYVIYLGALDSVFSYLAWIKRVYRLLNAYTPENYILPDIVLRSLGFSNAMIAVMRQNKTQFWQMINELVLYSRKFTCPAVMDLMNRHYWMNDNVYTDANTLNSQFYLFNQWGFYKFAMLDMPDGNPGPGLQMVLNPIANMVDADFSLDTLYQFGRDLIDALVEWDDSYTISGYLRRAYEGSPSFVVEEIPAVTMFTPAYVEEVLAQIENARVVPSGMVAISSDNIANFNVTQDVSTNAIISNPKFTLTGITPGQGGVYGTGAAMLQPIINCRSQQPTVADSVIASRLQAAVNVLYGANNTAEVTISAGTEIPLQWRIYYGPNVNNVTDLDQVVQATQVSTFGQFLGLCRMESFDWHPIAYMVYSNTSLPNLGIVVVPIGDVHNITTISRENLENLHKICIYSELNAFNQ